MWKWTWTWQGNMEATLRQVQKVVLLNLAMQTKFLTCNSNIQLVTTSCWCVLVTFGNVPVARRILGLSILQLAVKCYAVFITWLSQSLIQCGSNKISGSVTLRDTVAGGRVLWFPQWLSFFGEKRKIYLYPMLWENIQLVRDQTLSFFFRPKKRQSLWKSEYLS